MAMSYNRALSALKSGARVIVTHSEDRTFWSIDGRTIHPAAVKKLIPALKPQLDGLFGAETAQTYEYAGLPA